MTDALRGARRAGGGRQRVALQRVRRRPDLPDAGGGDGGRAARPGRGARRPGFQNEGDTIAFAGEFEPHLPGSELAKLRGEELPTELPERDLAKARAAQEAVRDAVRAGDLASAPRRGRGRLPGGRRRVLPGGRDRRRARSSGPTRTRCCGCSASARARASWCRASARRSTAWPSARRSRCSAPSAASRCAAARSLRGLARRPARRARLAGRRLRLERRRAPEGARRACDCCLGS